MSMPVPAEIAAIGALERNELDHLLSARQLRCRPTEAAKMIVRIGFGGPDIERPKRASKSAKRTSGFSTEVVNRRGKLAKITAHRSAPPLDPVVAITGKGASASSWSRPIRGHRRPRKSERLHAFTASGCLSDGISACAVSCGGRPHCAKQSLGKGDEM